MKSAAKKLIASAIVLVVALSLAVTSTFAWFTMSNDPKVESLNVNVTTSNGLLISATGEEGTYRAILPALDIIKAYYGEAYTNQTAFDHILTAVTSTNGIAFTKIDGTTNAAAGSYLSFDLYFLSDVAQTIKLQPSATNTKVISTPNEDEDYVNLVKYWGATTLDADYYGTAQGEAWAPGTEIEADAMHAARVSFVNGASAKVWNPYVTDAGYDDDENNLALDYYKYMNNITSITVPSTVTSIISEDIYDETLLTLTKGTGDTVFKGTLTVNIWLEGFDGDCLDSIYGDIISVLLQFVGAPVV